MLPQLLQFFLQIVVIAFPYTDKYTNSARLICTLQIKTSKKFVGSSKIQAIRMKVNFKEKTCTCN